MFQQYQKVFIVLIVFFLSMPLLYIFGVYDPSIIYGAENINDLPSIREKSFFKKDFQTLFEKWWNSHYFSRKILLKLKNQIYDWVNLNSIHAGYSGNIVEGKNHYLFERAYFSSLKQNCVLLPDNFKKIKELNDLFRKKNIDLYFILAPNKVLTYPDYLPERYRYFLGEDCKYYEVIESELNRWKIHNFNAQTLTSNIRKQEVYQPFSVTGTHWNLYGVGRTIQEAAKKFQWVDIEITDIAESDEPWTTEKDLSNLLNLIIPFNPQQKFYKPMLQAKKTLPGRITIIGNSFSNEFKNSLIDFGLTSDLKHFGNKPLEIKNLDDIKKSQIIIMVYTYIDFINNDNQLYKKIDFLLKNLKYDVNYN